MENQSRSYFHEDGASWRHWDHKTLPHWDREEQRRVEASEGYVEKWDPERGRPHSPYVPLHGLYSSKNMTNS